MESGKCDDRGKPKPEQTNCWKLEIRKRQKL